MRKKVLYLVIWEKYPNRKDSTEQLYENVTADGTQEALGEFHWANPSVAIDPRVVVIVRRNGRRT